MNEAGQVLQLEIRAARLAATLDARPALGALWRRMVGIAEASATMSMENIGVPESDIARPPLGLSLVQGEPQSARAARDIYRMLLRPGSLRTDPVGVFDRAVEATNLTDLIDDGRGGYVSYPIDVEVDMWRHGRELFEEHAPKILRDAPPPVLGAFALARLAAACMPDRQPMTERLIFMAAEHELRRDIVMSDPIVSRNFDGLDRKVDASWVCLPSLSLARGGLRNWSVERPQARELLLERMHSTLGRETGRLGPLNAWALRLEEDFRGKNSRSRRADFASLIKETPILNATTAAEALGITRRGARKLIEEAETMGLITQIAPRDTYRIWAVPALADMIQERGRAPFKQRGSQKASPKQGTKQEAHAAQLSDDQDFEARVGKVLAELDTALAGADAVLEKYKLNTKRL